MPDLDRKGALITSSFGRIEFAKALNRIITAYPSEYRCDRMLICKNYSSLVCLWYGIISDVCHETGFINTVMIFWSFGMN